MRAWSLILGLILMGMLSGCAQNTSLVGEEWGTAYKLTVASQILNPDAEKNLEPVVGLSETAADKAVNKYNKEFDKAPQAPVYSLGAPTGLGMSTTSSSTSSGGR